MSEFLLVGIDGSPSADRALTWAIEEARRRSLELQLVGVWQTPVAVAGPASAIAVPTMVRVARHRAEHVVGIAAKRAADAGVTATEEVLEGHPADVLLSLAPAADQLVVGDRGASAVARFLVGSVTSAVAQHAVGPVTVVRGEMTPVHHRVVVGLDGSPESQAALRRAAVEAAALGAEVHALAVWRVIDPDLAGDFTGHRIPQSDDLREWADARAEAMLREEAPALASCRVRLDIQHGDAADVLLRAAEHADLLVVGTRGLGAVDRMLLGSVSATCLHRAPCPVQIVPA